jgi:putative endonuclease
MKLAAYFLKRHSRLLNRPSVLEKDGAALSPAEIGVLGEAIAARYLQGQAARVLCRNFRAPGGGEIDIVIRHGKILAFVEVKARTSSEYGRPADAVNKDKQHLISRGVNGYLRLLHYPSIPWRCDIIEVHLRHGVPPQVNWIQSAFQIDELKRARPRNW